MVLLRNTDPHHGAVVPQQLVALFIAAYRAAVSVPPTHPSIVIDDVRQY
ncbi:hypothetical protein [Pyrodictium abyssi]